MKKGLSTPHFHKMMTEYYLVLSGKGTMRIQEIKGSMNEVVLEPGIIVRVDPNELHQTNTPESLVLETITTPTWTAEDEIVSNESLF